MPTGLVHIITYGCQMNEHDSEQIAGLLTQLGYEPTPDPAEADLIVVNTCTVRHSADEKIIGHVSHLNRYKLQNPGLLIAVGGCLVQDPQGREQLIRRAAHVDVLFGTDDLTRLPDLIERARCGETPLTTVAADPTRRRLTGVPVSRRKGYRAYITITSGCDNYCSYCIVPYVRGHMVSRTMQDVIEEAAELLGEGYRELFLLGQNVNAYGSDLSPRGSFAELLTEISDLPGRYRVRFATSHPRDFTLDMADTVLDLAPVCEHFHLPVQSGSDRVLSAMNRGYDRDHYLALVRRIRDCDPDAGLSTDLIVGFPGETEDDFADTLDLVRQAEFDQAFTFMYSPRTGTTAAEMPDQIPGETKRERLSELMAVQQQMSLQRNLRLVERTVEVLVEGPDRTGKQLTGRTRSNRIIHFKAERLAVGDFASVLVERAGPWALSGRLQAQDGGEGQ